MSIATFTIGPEHQGQTMSLDDFDKCESRDGYLYELAGGVVVVINVPKPRHGLVVRECRKQLDAYDSDHPGRIQALFGGAECKVLIPTAETERHPDLALYLSPCPDPDEDIWSSWIPELVIEVVSKSSSNRDYVEKRADYLKAEIQEYWILDSFQNRMTQLIRADSEWTEQILDRTSIVESTLLPGFEFDLKRVFDAAKR